MFRPMVRLDNIARVFILESILQCYLIDFGIESLAMFPNYRPYRVRAMFVVLTLNHSASKSFILTI